MFSLIPLRKDFKKKYRNVIFFSNESVVHPKAHMVSIEILTD